MAYLGLLAVRVVAQPFECLVLLDEEPYRLEGGGGTSGFILPLGWMDEGGWKSQRHSARRGVMGHECARVWDEI